MENSPYKKLPGSPRNDVFLLSVVSIIPVLIAWMVFSNNNTTMDERVFAGFAPYISPGITTFMKTVTFLGNHKFLIPANLVLIALFLLVKRKDLALTVFIVATSNLLLQLGLKELFQRPRPAYPMVDGISNFSFPSGHALMSIAFYGFLVWVILQHVVNKPLRISLVVFLVLLILVIGFSRIYLRVHYASDVISGYCIGIAWLWLCLYIIQKKKRSSGLIPEQ